MRQRWAGGSLPVALSHVSKSDGKRFMVLIDAWDAFFREAKFTVVPAVL